MSAIPSISFALLVLALVWLAIAVSIAGVSDLSTKRFANVEIACWSFLLAPVAISYILWMGMLLFPGRIPPCGYLSGVPMLAVAVLALSRGRLVSFAGGLVCEIRRLCGRCEMPRAALAFTYVFVALLLCACVVWSNSVESYRFDMAEYLLGGDHFARVADVSYNGPVVDPRNGFWYHTYHSYCLPLFAAWGCLVREAFGGKTDWYYRFVMLYYALGLNFVAFACFCRMRLDGAGKAIAVCAFVVLNGMPFVCCELPLEFQCDFARVSLITAIALLLWRHQACPQWSSCIVLGMLCSAAVGVHGTSILFVGALGASLLFARTEWWRRMLHMCAIAAVVALTWGLHYVLQSVWGDGWLFPVVGEELASRPTDPWIAERFSGPLSLLHFGYLGQVANIWHFSLYFVFVAMAVLAWLRSREKLPACHVAELTAVVLSMVAIATTFYYNFRYQYTFVPLIVLVAFTVLARYGATMCRLCCLLTLGYIALSAALAASMFLSHGIPGLSSVDGRRGRGGPIACLMQSCRASACPWPEVRDSAVKVCFCSANEMPYRDAPCPVWFLGKDMSVRGRGRRHVVPRSEFARTFGYFLLEDRMRAYAERGVFDCSDWNEERRSGDWTLYKSKLVNADSGQGVKRAEQ